MTKLRDIVSRIRMLIEDARQHLFDYAALYHFMMVEQAALWLNFFYTLWYRSLWRLQWNKNKSPGGDHTLVFRITVPFLTPPFRSVLHCNRVGTKKKKSGSQIKIGTRKHKEDTFLKLTSPFLHSSPFFPSCWYLPLLVNLSLAQIVKLQKQQCSRSLPTLSCFCLWSTQQ